LTLIPKLAEFAHCPMRLDNYALKFDGSLRLEDAEQAIRELRNVDAKTLGPSIDESALIGLKFSACLPDELGMQILVERLADTEGAGKVLRQDFTAVLEG
jgi:ATP-dependent helicase Lhr and Lhr-like helicase